jgi:integrase/recombinase XerD
MSIGVENCYTGSMHNNEDSSSFVVVSPGATSEVDFGVPTGLTRDRTNQLIAAENDADLLSAYLGRGGLSPKSVENTKKEVERFLLWCQRSNVALRDVRTEHLIAYSAFLMDPQPAEVWVSKTKWPKSSPHWRPFTGRLSTSSHRQAMVAIRSMFAWATDARYLPANPAALLGKMKTPHESRVARYLSKDAVDLIFTAAQVAEVNTPSARMRKARDQFLVIAYYMTGARLAELVTADMGAIYQEDGRWWLDIIGKGAKPRRLPVSQRLLTAFEEYRVAYGLLPRTIRGDKTPLILTSRGGLLRATEGAVSNAVKAALEAAARLADIRGNEEMGASLRKASTHWLRHSVFTHLANNGVPLTTVQATAGHAKLSTTGLYLHKQDHERHDEIISTLDKL